MLATLFIAWSLMAFCVAVHAMGLAYAVKALRRRVARLRLTRQWITLFIGLAAWMIALHLVEIGAWAAFYTWEGAMQDIQSAFYFSAVTYTTTGYGDLVLSPPYRFLGAVEALTGILMCGWSTGFFFAVINRMFENNAQAASKRHEPAHR